MPRFVVSTDEDSMAAAAMSLDLVLNTVSANHDINHYLPLLVRWGDWHVILNKIKGTKKIV